MHAPVLCLIESGMLANFEGWLTSGAPVVAVDPFACGAAGRQAELSEWPKFAVVLCEHS